MFCLLFIVLRSSGVGYRENINPDSENLGFSAGQFQTFTSFTGNENRSSIFVPNSVILNSTGKSFKVCILLVQENFEKKHRTQNVGNTVQVWAGSFFEKLVKQITELFKNASILKSMNINWDKTFNCLNGKKTFTYLALLVSSIQHTS